MRPDGTVPRVDVIHLHHGVWLVGLQPTFAAGEEKTIFSAPKGFGWGYKPSDKWYMNYMIHNLTPTADKVYITYDMDFVPASAKKAKRMTSVQTQWLDVEGGKAYPVFDVLRGTGKSGRYTFPDDSANPYPDGVVRNRWVADRNVSIVATAGHLHPGGLWTDLRLTRNGKTVRLFRSKAKYWEPAGAVSWDVAMTATPPKWRVAVKKGDVLSVHGTYDSKRASWYESMAIMPLAIAEGTVRGAKDPFKHKVDVPGRLTHGHLPENNNHGGGQSGLPDVTNQLDGPVSSTQVTVDGFVYSQGDFSNVGMPLRPAVVRQGQQLTFLNRDSSKTIFHTITSCKLPCNGSTGIAYPLADGPQTFDSGELGFGLAGFTAAANRDSWQSPANLPVGTYSYFCRIHPFMRGAFRVIPAAK
jgi:hypothetical protein